MPTPASIECDQCGETIAQPSTPVRTQVRCPVCHAYNKAPREWRQGYAPPSSTERDVRDDKPLAFVEPEILTPISQVLAGTQEDDGNPYAVPGEATRKCPDCGGVCRHDAVLCTNCGLDLETGKKQRRKKFEPVERFWEARWPLNTRLLIFAGMQALNFCICAVIGLLSGSLNFAIVAFILQTALQAFLIGSYESLTVRRNAKGHTTIDRVWRLGFIPLPVTPIDWKESHGLGLVGSHDSGALEVGTAVYLFLCA
ncbi:MAG: hypothetical protein ACRCZF_14025, partial [Gemmataceae bacterium]